MNTNLNSHPRAGKLTKTTPTLIPAPQNHPPITKQSQFHPATTTNFVTKPGKSPYPAANPHRISKRIRKNRKILGFDMLKSRVRWPFSRVRWPQNPPYEPTKPDPGPHPPALASTPAYNEAIPAFQRTFCDR